MMLLALTMQAFAQQDFVLLKKGDRTVERYYKGMSISVYTTYGQLISGIVDKCRHDTIYITEQSKELVPTMYGAKNDIVNLGYIGVAINEIAIIPHKHLTWAAVGNTAVKLAVLAGCLVGVNSIHTTEKGDYAIGYGASIVVGFLVSQLTFFKNRVPPGYKIGRKYRLQYVDMTVK